MLGLTNPSIITRTLASKVNLLQVFTPYCITKPIGKTKRAGQSHFIVRAIIFIIISL